MPGSKPGIFFLLNYKVIALYFIYFKMQKEKKASLAIIINSTAFYLLSYLFIFILTQFATIVASRIFDIPNTFFYNKIGFNIKPETWTFDSVKVIYSSGNAFLVLVSISFLVIVVKTLELNGLLKMFFLWGFIHSISIFLGSFIIGAFTFDGFGIVLSYLYLTDTIKMLLLFAGIILLIAIGMLMFKPILFSANIYYNCLSPDMIRKFRRDQFIFPFLISTLFLQAVKFPLSVYDSLMLLIPFFVLLPLFWSTDRQPAYYFEENKKNITVSVSLVLLTIFLYVAYRVIFARGIYLG